MLNIDYQIEKTFHSKGQSEREGTSTTGNLEDVIELSNDDSGEYISRLTKPLKYKEDVIGRTDSFLDIFKTAETYLDQDEFKTQFGEYDFHLIKNDQSLSFGKSKYGFVFKTNSNFEMGVFVSEDYELKVYAKGGNPDQYNTLLNIFEMTFKNIKHEHALKKLYLSKMVEQTSKIKNHMVYVGHLEPNNNNEFLRKVYNGQLSRLKVEKESVIKIELDRFYSFKEFYPELKQPIEKSFEGRYHNEMYKNGGYGHYLFATPNQNTEEGNESLHKKIVDYIKVNYTTQSR